MISIHENEFPRIILASFDFSKPTFSIIFKYWQNSIATEKAKTNMTVSITGKVKNVLKKQ